MNAELRRKVRRRGRGRCEYCRTPLRYDIVPPEIDHVIAWQHGGSTTLSNLALACAHCNSHKGANIASVDPVGGTMTRLFHPRQDAWLRHFRLAGPIIVGLTPQGRATVRLLAMNSPAKLAARASLMEEGLY